MSEQTSTAHRGIILAVVELRAELFDSLRRAFGERYEDVQRDLDSIRRSQKVTQETMSLQVGR